MIWHAAATPVASSPTSRLAKYCFLKWDAVDFLKGEAMRGVYSSILVLYCNVLNVLYCLCCLNLFGQALVVLNANWTRLSPVPNPY